METTFVCDRCGNTDPRLVGHKKNGAPYCRKCVGFLGEEMIPAPLSPKTIGFHLSYSLSKEQKVLSEQLIENFKQGIDTLVYAVCGSGKTEISYGVIGYAMSKGMHVGFALPRRDVVIELYARLKDAFPSSKIVAVFGGHTDVLEGDCIILTTHQLYRYVNYFDLLVMDEIDAFPFKNNEVLQEFYKKSLRGHCIMMTATPSKEVVSSFQGEGKAILSLHTRFHKQPIPVPANKIAIYFTKYIFLIKTLKRFEQEKKPCLVFVPSITQSKTLAGLLSFFIKRGTYINSKCNNRSGIIKAFKEGKYAYLVTTAVLERGVTIENCQVIVFHADSGVYSSSTLIQIAGRAGRKTSAPNGEVYFIADYESKGMKRAIEEIEYCNRFLQGVHESF